MDNLFLRITGKNYAKLFFSFNKIKVKNIKLMSSLESILGSGSTKREKTKKTVNGVKKISLTLLFSYFLKFKGIFRYLPESA
jgi:hypothetical protein